MNLLNSSSLISLQFCCFHVNSIQHKLRFHTPKLFPIKKKQKSVKFWRKLIKERTVDFIKLIEAINYWQWMIGGRVDGTVYRVLYRKYQYEIFSYITYSIFGIRKFGIKINTVIVPNRRYTENIEYIVPNRRYIVYRNYIYIQLNIFGISV